MQTAVLACAVAAGTSWVLTPLVRRLALRVGAVDHPLSTRKIHARTIPRLGGGAIAVAFYAPVLLLVSMVDGFAPLPGWTQGMLVGAAMMGMLGAYDDLRGSSATLKLSVQLAIAGLAWSMGLRIENVSIPFDGHVALGWAGLPLTLLWVVGVTNALNLIDGLDGLAAGTAFIAAAAMGAGAFANGHEIAGVLAACTCGAVLGFLRWNSHPASIFLGDSGSLFLGFVLATLPLVARDPTQASSIALAVPVIALGLPILDTLLAIARRMASGAPLFQGDRDHIHHRLLQRGLSQRQVALALYAVCALFGLMAGVLSSATGWVALAVIVGFGAACALGLLSLDYFKSGNVAAFRGQRARNVELRNAVADARRQIRAARTPRDLWRAAACGGRALGAVEVQLHVQRLAPPADPRVTVLAGASPHHVVRRTVHSLEAERPGDALVLGWAAGELDRHTELAIEQLCRCIRRALGRLSRTSGRGGSGLTFAIQHDNPAGQS